jgi:dTDP-4-amino-4,6-dideoxygalactose transaminase
VPLTCCVALVTLTDRSTPLLRVAQPALPPFEAYAERLEAVWERSMLSNNGPAAGELEALCADYTGLAHVHAVASADVGLTLAVAALGLPAGSPVLVPSFTFASTLHALLWNGLTPIFADVDPGSWCLTAASVAPALEHEPRAIFGTHAFMAICDVAGLEGLTRDRGAALLYDAAQAFGTWVGDRHVGAWGDASVFSFSATKVVTTGEGGLAAFRDGAAAARFARLRGYGVDGVYEATALGLNGKLSELHAALGCVTVPRVEAAVAARLELADRYRERFDATAVGMQALAPGVRPTPTQLVVDLGARRDAVAAALAAEGIDSRPYFRPLHAMARYAGLARAPLPVTERLGASLLALPLHEAMNAAAVDRVCDAVLAALD